MKTKDDTITEGMEYQIVRYPGERVVFSGIAEDDGEAQWRLDFIRYRSESASSVKLTFKIEAL